MITDEITKGCKKEQVRQCLGFCTVDFWSYFVYEETQILLNLFLLAPFGNK